MWKEFQKIRSLVDVIPNITTPTDEKILASWEQSFRGNFNGYKLKVKSPYAITRNPKTGAKALWKEHLSVDKPF